MILLWLFIIWCMLMLVAIRLFPKEAQLRRRMRLFWFLVLPWALTFFFSPLIIDHHAASDELRGWMLTAQYTAIVLFCAIIAAAIFRASGARESAIAIGAANLVAAIIFIPFNVLVINASS